MQTAAVRLESLIHDHSLEGTTEECRPRYAHLESVSSSSSAGGGRLDSNSLDLTRLARGGPPRNCPDQLGRAPPNICKSRRFSSLARFVWCFEVAGGTGKFPQVGGLLPLLGIFGVQGGTEGLPEVPFDVQWSTPFSLWCHVKNGI